jgi:hypothetical protein
MRCRRHWIALPALLVSTAFVLGNPPKPAPPQNKPNPPKPPPHHQMPAWHPNGMPHWNGNGNMPKPTTAHIDYQLEPTGDMVVRLMSPPLQYDDKGFPKKYTADELKALKGDNPKLVGYQGDANDLKPGIQVKVYLVKDPPAARPAKEGEKADQPDKPDQPKYVAAGELTGQLTQVGNTTKEMTLRVSYLTYQGGARPNPGMNQKDAPKLQVGMIVVLAQPQDAPGK